MRVGREYETRAMDPQLRTLNVVKTNYFVYDRSYGLPPRVRAVVPLTVTSWPGGDDADNSASLLEGDT